MPESTEEPAGAAESALLAPVAAIVLAAGKSTRMRSKLPKPLHPLCGLPLTGHVVRACREAGYPVTAIPGASAVLTALAASGLPTDQFHFAGFLPPKSAVRRKAIDALKVIPATLLFFEAPQRLAATLADLAKILGAARHAAVARELTKLFEETKSSTLGELAAFYRANKARGEIVIVIAPPEKNATATDMSDIDNLLRDTLRTQSLRDAVTAVSAITGAKKGEVYTRALRLKGKSGS